MTRNATIAMSFVMLFAAACSEPFDFEAASPEDRQSWLEEIARGLADGLEKTLPRGSNGIYAQMGSVKADAAAKSISVVVEVTDGEERIANSTDQRNAMREQACIVYMNSDLNRDGIKVSVRYKVPGGGTAISLLMDPDLCAR